jgi:hypothetical protein
MGYACLDEGAKSIAVTHGFLRKSMLTYINPHYKALAAK